MEIFFGFMFSSLFTQHKVAKTYISTTALQKHKSNSVDLNQKKCIVKGNIQELRSFGTLSFGEV